MARNKGPIDSSTGTPACGKKSIIGTPACGKKSIIGTPACSDSSSTGTSACAKKNPASTSTKQPKHPKPIPKITQPSAPKHLPLNPTPEKLLKILQQNLKPCRGFRIMEDLIANSPRGIHVTKLNHLYFPVSEHAEQFDTYGEVQPGYICTDHSLPELPIPFVDKMSLEQAKRGYLQVLEREAQAIKDCNQSLVEDLIELREQFEDYFKDVVSRNGKIRNIQDQTHKDYMVIRNNLRNFLKKVRDFHPPYADYIQKHLEVRYIMVWRE